MKRIHYRISFFITWILFCLYSFTRRDLNLILYNPFPYSKFWEQTREFLTNLGYFHRPLVTNLFIIFVLIFTFLYLKLIKQKLPPNNKILFKFLIPIAVLGIISYPMFSHDIFNYLFNAKMVLIYQVNPHMHTAIEFLSDPMTRFMHNIHTPAPYAYGWTVVSLLPGLAWFTEKFVLSFWAMKLFIAIFWLAQLWILKKLVNKLFPHQSWRWQLFVLSPLVLIETLIIGHNDVVMMFPALLGYWFLLKSKKLLDKYQFLSIILLLFSISIKYATVVILPLFLLKPYLKKLNIPAVASFLLFAVMFTRPGQLHSWYLIWAFSFAILSKSRFIVSLFTSLTIGALLRYVPYIYYGNWNPPVYLIRNIIWLLSVSFTPFIVKYTSKLSNK